MLNQTLSKDRILTDKERKNLAILDVIRKYAPIARAEISKHTGLNIVTISNYINNYLEKGVVVEGEFDVSTGGRKPILIEMNKDYGYVIGIGVCFNYIIGLMINMGTEIIFEVREKNNAKDISGMVDIILNVGDKLIKGSKIDKNKVFGIGIGIPGVIGEEGRIIHWPDAFGIKGNAVFFPIKERVKRHFNIPVFMENDANAALLGEKWLSTDRDVRNMIYFFSEVGAGFLLNGQLYRGSKFAAGEIGIISEDEEEKSPLARGRIDLGVSKMAAEVAKNGGTLLEGSYKKKGYVSFNDFVAVLKKGDEKAVKIAKKAAVAFGKKVAFWVNALNPDMVIIGGGIEDMGEIFLDQLRDTVYKWALDEALRDLRIIPSSFGYKAIAIGAGGVVTRELFLQI